MRSRLLSFFLSFIIIFSVCFNPSFLCRPVVVEGAPAVGALVSYFLSVTGAVDKLTGGGVTKITGTTYDMISQKVSSLMGSGIYEDSQGNYVFSGTATQELYEALYGNNDLQGVRVVSNFPGLTPMAGLTFYHNQYCSPAMQKYINDSRTLYSSYLCYGGYSNVRYGGQVICQYNIFDLSQVAYLVINNTEIDFYNAAGTLLNVNYTYGRENYFTNSGFSGSVGVTTESKSYFYIDSASNSETNAAVGDYASKHDYSTNPLNSFIYNLFPFIYTDGSGSVIWSNKSIIIANSVASANAYYKKQSGIYVANTYNTLPSISKTVIENNDWSNIYNNYVTNVNNYKDIYFDSETGTYNNEELLKYMKEYNSSITSAIESGIEDVESLVLDTNGWLKKINDRLAKIQSFLESGSGGGSSSAEILDAIKRVENNLSQSIDEMGKIYVLLGKVYDALLALDSGGGGSGLDGIVVSGGSISIDNYVNPTVNLPDLLSDLLQMPDTSVLDNISKVSVFTDTLNGVVPFCFVSLVIGLVEWLGVEPETPQFTIPVKLQNSTIDIDESIDIDFSVFSPFHSFWVTILDLSFIITLIILTVKLLLVFIELFG